MGADAIFQFKKMLKNLDGCMDKAAAYADAKKFDVNVLLQTRLAPDMFPFVRQVQSACDAAKFCAAYLSGKSAPKHEDNEATWAEAHQRIKKCLTYLEEFKAQDFANLEKVQAKPAWAKGQWIPGDEYLLEIAIPNFYFHVTTAYAILRHSGVDIGKSDYMGQLNLQGTRNG